MKKLLLFLGALALQAQQVSLSDTLTNAVGGAAYTGRITVTLSTPGNAQPLYYSTTSLSGWQYVLCVGVTGSDCSATTSVGVVTIPLYANSTITPAGTSYAVRFSPSRGTAWAETWTVEASDTKLYQVRATAVPSPTVTFQASQLVPGTAGQVLTTSGGVATWAAAGGVTSLTGTANQITASASTGAVTLSIPTNPTLPGTTTGTFTGALTGNASTATALASNPTDCSAGQYATTIAASGNLTCAAVQSLTVAASGNAQQILDIDPAETSARNFYMWEGSFSNAGDTRGNNVVRMGWNVAAGGGSYDGTDAVIADEWEGHYAPDANRYLERHITYTSAAGVASRLASWMVNKSTNVATGSFTGDTWAFLRRSDATPILQLSYDTTRVQQGNLIVGSQNSDGYNFDVNGLARVYNQAGVTRQNIRAGSAQSGGTLSSWSSYAGSTIAYVGADGEFYSTAGVTAGTQMVAPIYMSNVYDFGIREGSMNLKASYRLGWTATTKEYDSIDTGLERASSANVRVTNGSSGLGKIVVSQSTPAASSDACTAGALWADASYIYACTASGTIKRAALSTF